MATLSRDLRRELERVIIQARSVGVVGAEKALDQLAVANDKPWPSMMEEQKRLRVRLRAHGRQLGDKIDARGGQSIRHLAQECAYEHWHRMLFARFLAESNLLIEPNSGVSISLHECRELARQQSKDWLVLASEFAVGMLPQIFRSDDPVLQISLPPETRNELEALLKSLQAEVFTADDSLGWVYQFWQSEEKKRVNDSGVKIGADELPAVTELFTEDYMVWFLLHNTLGAWWAAKRKQEGEDANLPSYEWSYLRLKEDGTPAAGSFDGWPLYARDLKVLDPCMGSGHFLVFALPILVSFRMDEEGLTREQAVQAVLRDNLFGLEIDLRCTQIAAFNVALTAWRMIGYRPLPPLNLACSGLGINAKEEDWIRLGGSDGKLRETMKALYRLFDQAPLLGSLIDPRRAVSPLFAAHFGQVQPLLEQAMSTGQSSENTKELAVAAQGIFRAAQILAEEYTLVVTNVPYLGRGKQDESLREYAERFHSAARADLATCFAERCVRLCAHKGTAAMVVPQNWLFLGKYEAFREKLLRETAWNTVGRLGPHAFETISGEVVSVALWTATQVTPPEQHTFLGLVANEAGDAAGKSKILRIGQLISMSQSAQLKNPDARVVFGAETTKELLANVAFAHKGITTNDDPQFLRSFWELPSIADGWEFHQSTVDAAVPYGGRELVILYESGKGKLRALAEAQERDRRQDFRGANAWGHKGVAVSLMTELFPTLYTGEKFDTNVAAIVPNHSNDLAAIWAFCKSQEFKQQVRSIDQKLNVTNATLVKIPFDADRWRAAARDAFPQGLPAPSSTDPTQWLFAGHPRFAAQIFHVAVARLVGYRWPRQTGSGFVDCPALGFDGLERNADVDGVACLTSLHGERPAADRLRSLLADAFPDKWSATKQNELLAQVGYGGKSLEEWLRDAFFEQHSELFHQRPFIWHIWDGLRDGFHALVNYHKLAAPNGTGRQTLQKLTYSYLGDWIERQRTDQKSGVEGADGRLAAALQLKKELEKILEGEPPYDIFVRWKPLYEQPLGWEPDINDGVRINIRPFMTAKTIKGSRNGCILRFPPSGVRWDKADRGNEPHRPKEDFPWFWKWDGKTQDFEGGSQFDGKRWNDLHYSLEKKKEARERCAERTLGKKPQGVSR